MSDENITDIQCDITGPQGTPYESGVFRMKLALGVDFPTAPPKAYFVTRIFHPNVSTEGEICVNTLKKDWSPNLGIKHIITVIRCLLIDPNPESVLNEEAGRLLLDKYEDFAQHAKLMTEIHAKSMGVVTVIVKKREQHPLDLRQPRSAPQRRGRARERSCSSGYKTNTCLWHYVT
jgi:ubiquitin-conjugating enzyme E2 S